MKNCKLYVILDREIIGRKDILKIAEDVLRGGADIIQLRDKSAGDRALVEEAGVLCRLAKKHKKIFIVNDRVDIALAVNADGVHLGQGDMPLACARGMLKRKIIGVSTHSFGQALKAEKSGADYIGIGPIFKSSSKPELHPIGIDVLKRVKQKISIPFFAIGGVGLGNIGRLKNFGVDRIAAISAVVKSKDVCRAARALKHELK